MNIAARKKIVLLTVLVFSCITFVQSLAYSSYHLKCIIITDRTGAKVEITDPKFDYSETYDNPKYNCLNVLSPDIRDGKGISSVLIHFSRIKTVTYKKHNYTYRLKVTLDNGETITGIAPDSKMKVTGEGFLGKVSYSLADIQTIEFHEISRKDSGVKDPIAVPRQEWAENRQKELNEELPWEITYSGKAVAPVAAAVWDSYIREGYISGFTWKNGPQKNGSWHTYDFDIVVGVARYDGLKFEDIKKLEFTGTMGTDGAEVSIEKKEGKKATGNFVLLSKRTGTPPVGFSFKPSEVTYTLKHGVDKDDMLYYSTSYGWAGISLYNCGHIIMTAQ